MEAAGIEPADHSPRFRGELTENERRIGLGVAAGEGGETRRWLNLVLEAYDAAIVRIAHCEQALFTCFVEAGADTDGVRTLAEMGAVDIAERAMEAVRELRTDYDEADAGDYGWIAREAERGLQPGCLRSSILIDIRDRALRHAPHALRETTS